MIDLDAPCLQSDFGVMVGISQQAVSTHASSGLLKPGAPLREWLLAYCDHLREQAAGRSGTELANQRALLAAAQRERIEMQNAITRKDHAPVQALQIILAQLGRRLGVQFSSIVPNLRQRVPDLPVRALEVVEEVVTEARNAAAEVTFEVEDEPLVGEFVNDGFGGNSQRDQGRLGESQEARADLGG